MQAPADQAADDWESEVLVSISSCLRCGLLACGHLHNPVVLCGAWGPSSCHQVHAMVITATSSLPCDEAEVNNPFCHAGSCSCTARAGGGGGCRGGGGCCPGKSCVVDGRCATAAMWCLLQLHGLPAAAIFTACAYWACLSMFPGAHARGHDIMTISVSICLPAKPCSDAPLCPAGSGSSPV